MAALLALGLLLGEAAQAGQQFTIIFGTGKSRLTHEARKIVTLIVKEARAQHSTSLAVAGYGDGFGDPAHDATLAEQRARSVIAALKHAGVAPAMIAQRPALPPDQATGIPVHKVTVTLLP